MEIRAYHICIIFNCFFIPSLVAKTFSLNEAIAAEEGNKATVKSPKLSDTFLKPDRILPLGFNILNFKEISKSLSTSIGSPLKYRKPFQIKSPLWPKTLKRPQKGLQFTIPSKQAKRGLDNYEEINENYNPIFKSLSVILDNIFHSNSGKTVIPRNKYKRNPINKFESNDVVCSCAIKSTTESYLSESYEEAASSVINIATEFKTEATTPPSIATPKTHHITNINIRNLRQNKDIPILPPRNTSGVWRNIDEFHERRSTSHINNDKGSITGYNGNNEHNTGIGNVQPDTKNSEENTNSDTRYGSSSHEPRGLLPNRTNTRDSGGFRFDEYVYGSNDSIQGNIFGHEGENKLPNRGIETESPILLSKSPTRLQKLEPQKTKIVEATKDEKDYAAIERHITSAKRISNRNSQNSSNNKKSRRANETITSNRKESPHNKVVMIFDGYSVARDVNGQNKMSEKAIEIHS